MTMHRPTWDRQLETATQAALAAGKLLWARFGGAQAVRHKGEIDLVTEADEAAEAEIVSRLQQAFPTHRILAEEGSVGGDDPTYLWIVDPLDGTTNYAHGYPVFAVSIALEVAGVVEVGVVYQPILGELFTAVRGRGAHLNGSPIRVSTTARLLESFVCTGFPYDRTALEAAVEEWRRVIRAAQAVRRDGAAALDLCYVAMGRFDGFWERWLQPWDMAAGALIVAEAGGQLSDYGGGALSIRSSEVVASNGLIHEELLRRLAEPARTGAEG